MIDGIARRVCSGRSDIGDSEGLREGDERAKTIFVSWKDFHFVHLLIGSGAFGSDVTD
jgi:hypothetical protein